jgi:hypothetical protein
MLEVDQSLALIEPAPATAVMLVERAALPAVAPAIVDVAAVDV